MAKRKLEANGAEPNRNHHAKRQKVPAESYQAEHVDIYTSQQLRELFVFQQNDIDGMLHGIRTFKSFLTSISNPTDNHDVGRSKAILREYLDAEKPAQGDKTTTYCSPLLQAWSFAQSANHDTLFSSIASFFAGFIRLLSSDIDLTSHSKGLARILLREEQLKLISRGLSAPKHKPHIIGPCLRLCTEIVSLDGGAVARSLYSHREHTFDAATMARNLHLTEVKADEQADPIKKPSIRTHAVRYLLANLRFQGEAAKTDMIKQNNIWSSLLSSLSADYPALVVEILSALNKHVVADRSILRMNKGHLFNYRNLQALYEYYKSTEGSEAAAKANQSAYDFLLLICTSSEAGVLRPSNGWYFGKIDSDDASAANGTDKPNDTQDLSLGHDRLQIRNRVLGDFALTLRPYADNSERKLLMAIFEAAPELVADYFQRKRGFTFDPKLTTTWVGYAAVLFSITQLSIPRNLGSKLMPPSFAIVMESILPQPLSSKVLTNCLQSSASMVRLFAVRVLIGAFEKLVKVRAIYVTAEDTGAKAWAPASEALESMFSQRAPAIADVIATFRQVSKDDVFLKESITRLLSLYFQVLPQVALDEKIDISVALTEILQELDTDESSLALEARGIKLLQLNSLIRIAEWSPTMSWWNKPQSLRFSPFTTVLRLAAKSTPSESIELRALLTAIVATTGAMSPLRHHNSVHGLIDSLRDFTESTDLFNFIDDCFARLAKRPIKYEDDLVKFADESYRGEVHSDILEPFSLLIVVLLEQWPYRCKLDKAILEPMSNWLASFLASLNEVEDARLLTSAKNEFAKSINEKTLANNFKTRAESTPAIKDTTSDIDMIVPEQSLTNGTTQPSTSTAPKFEPESLAPPQEDPKHRALARLANPTADLEAYIEDNHLAELLTYLSSPSLATRRQTIASLRNFILRLEQTEHPDTPQITLLLKELIETYTARATAESGTEQPLPSLTTSLAARCLPILANPLHAMYPKINAFLLSSPSWRVEKLPVQLGRSILSTQPSDRDDPIAYWREVHWLLEWLYDGIRTPRDAAIMRNSGLWERILNLFFDEQLGRFMRLDLSADEGSANFNGGQQDAEDADTTVLNGKAGTRRQGPATTPQAYIRSLIVKLVCRTALVQDGANDLITRNGILAWLGCVRQRKLLSAYSDEMLVDIEAALLGRGDQGKLAKWGPGLFKVESEEDVDVDAVGSN